MRNINVLSALSPRSQWARLGALRSEIPLTMLVLLSACSLGDHPQIVTYTVNSVNTPSSSCKSKHNLQVMEPTVGPGLDTIRIAVMEGNEKINYYTGVKWAAPISEMVQSVLVNSFEKDGSFASVSTPAQAIQADATLMTDIRDFEVLDASSGKIRVRMMAKLVTNKDKKVLANIPFEKEATPSGVLSIDSVIATFNATTAEAAAAIAKGSTANCKPAK